MIPLGITWIEFVTVIVLLYLASLMTDRKPVVYSDVSDYTTGYV